MPPGHEGARQALSELRGIVDAERHRIRRKLIRNLKLIGSLENSHPDPQAIRGMTGEKLMAEALTLVTLAGAAVPGSCIAERQLHLLLLTAVVESIRRIAHHDEEGYEHSEKAGSEARQSGRKLGAVAGSVKVALFD